jgi:hypothetical protein
MHPGGVSLGEVDIMPYHYDQFAKQIGRRALDRFGATLAHAEIAPEVQYADLQHEPDPARSAGREQLGLLGQITSRLCLIEVYSDAPAGEEFRACLSKHIAFSRQRTRKARADNKAQEREDQLPAVVVAPFLWVITAGVPTTLLAELELEAASDWPPGVYLFGGNVLRVGIVMASKLPRERSTLLVRLMAAGPLLPVASTELFNLPPDAPERAVAERSLVKLYQALKQKPNRDPEEEEFIETMYTTMEEYRVEGLAKGRAEGRAEGRAAGLAEGLLIMLRGRGIAVPDAARERILSEKDAERLARWLERAGVTTSIDELLGDAR